MLYGKMLKKIHRRNVLNEIYSTSYWKLVIQACLAVGAADVELEAVVDGRDGNVLTLARRLHRRECHV